MTQPGTSPHNASSRALLDAVRADAQAGNGALDGALRAAVFAYASARALGQAPEANPPGVLPDDVRSFVDAVLTRAVDADVEALRRGGRSDDFVYELAIVAAVAAGSARGGAGFALLQGAQRGAP